MELRPGLLQFFFVPYYLLFIMNPSDLKDQLIDKLDLYSKEELKIGIVKFLTIEQCIDLMDSLDREVF